MRYYREYIKGDEKMGYKDWRIIDGKARWVIVDEYGNIINKEPSKEQLKSSAINCNCNMRQHKIDIDDDTIKRFFYKVHKNTDTGCWEWGAYGDHNDRGYFGIEDNKKWRMILSSHISWLIKNGKLPNGYLLHKYDNASCVNPDHLYIGTQKDNGTDMAKRCRSSYGERNGQAKLAQEDIIKIREWYKQGHISQSKLGDMFGVHQVHIGRIVRGERWSIP